MWRIEDVKDYSSGFRAYQGRAILKGWDVFGKCLIKEKGFTCMAEILYRLASLGIKVSEVPLILRYDRKVSASKIRIFPTILSYMKLLINLPRSFEKDNK